LSITLSASLIPFSGIHSTFYSISYVSGILSLPAESHSLCDSVTFAKAYFHHPQLNWGFYLAFSAHKKTSVPDAGNACSKLFPYVGIIQIRFMGRRAHLPLSLSASSPVCNSECRRARLAATLRLGYPLGIQPPDTRIRFRRIAILVAQKRSTARLGDTP